MPTRRAPGSAQRLALSVLACAASLASTGCAVTRVDRVSTRAARITDPDYTGAYRLMGDKELADRRYPQAWTEFAAMGDYESLRRVLFAYADDTEKFDARIFESMVTEYARGYARQHDVADPVDHLDASLAAASDRHAAAGTLARAQIAWAVRYRYHLHVTPFPSRSKHFPQLLALRDQLAGSGDAEVRAFAESCTADIEALQRDAMGRL